MPVSEQSKALKGIIHDDIGHHGHQSRHWTHDFVQARFVWPRMAEESIGKILQLGEVHKQLIILLDGRMLFLLAPIQQRPLAILYIFSYSMDSHWTFFTG